MSLFRVSPAAFGLTLTLYILVGVGFLVAAAAEQRFLARRGREPEPITAEMVWVFVLAWPLVARELRAQRKDD